MNSGSLRADFNPGEITVEDVLNVYPFIDAFRVVEVDGNGVRELLEYSYALHYGYAQMAGIEAIYDSRKPAGERLIEAKVGGEPLDPAKHYTVVSSAFLANGGDGYAMLAAGKSIGQVAQTLAISEQTFHRWRNQYGGMKAEEAKRLKELEQENKRLKKLVADLTLDKDILKEALEGNW